MRFFVCFLAFFCGFSGFAQMQKKELTVYFESGIATLNAVEQQKIDALFSNKKNVLVASVGGFCDDIGSENENAELSNQRAKFVAQYLEEKYHQKTVERVANGEIGLSILEEKNPKKYRKLNRKAIIAFEILVEKTVVKSTKKDSVDNFIGYKTINDSLEIGDKIILRHLLFQGGRTAFFDPEEATAELDEIADYFIKNPNIQFSINGHVCCITKSFYDARDLDSGKNNLSETRAKKIYDFFIAKGIAPWRMTHQGFGRQHPRTGVAEQLNKRVEIVIVKN